VRWAAAQTCTLASLTLTLSPGRLYGPGREVAAMDVLAPGIGEVIGGSQREERLDVLDRNMAERGIDREHYAPTLPSPASGGGLGRGICAATARCRTPASASASSAPSPTSPASPTCATRSPSRAPPAALGIDADCFGDRDRWILEPSWKLCPDRSSPARSGRIGPKDLS
jgi:hypothetical protein